MYMLRGVCAGLFAVAFLVVKVGLSTCRSLFLTWNLTCKGQRFSKNVCEIRAISVLTLIILVYSYSRSFIADLLTSILY